MIILTKKQIGSGWKETPYNKILTFTDQFLDLKTGKWSPCALYYSDNVKNVCQTNYRSPANFFTKMLAFFEAIPMIFKRKIQEFKIKNHE